jgi:hypothetical protein
MTNDPMHRGLVWRPDGHVSDWALSALVDGEADLVPEDASTHLDTCEHCLDRLGAVAHSAFALGEDLKIWAESEVRHRIQFPVASFGVVSLAALILTFRSWQGRGVALSDVPHRLFTIARNMKFALVFLNEKLGAEIVFLSSFLVFGMALVLAAWVRKYSLGRNPESLS